MVCPPPELSFGGQYYSVVDGVCSRDESFFGGKPVLTQAVGYAVVLGFGAFFALFTSFLVQCSNKISIFFRSIFLVSVVIIRQRN